MRKICRGGFSCTSEPASSHARPTPRKTPTNESRFAAASTSPFFRRLVRPVLQQRRDRHDEKAAEEAEQRQQRQAPLQRQPRQRQQRGEDGQAERAQRHQAVFDFAAGQIAGRNAAQADAERQRHVEETDCSFRPRAARPRRKRTNSAAAARRGN
jgi:hypothetical protein